MVSLSPAPAASSAASRPPPSRRRDEVRCLVRTATLSRTGALLDEGSEVHVGDVSSRFALGRGPGVDVADDLVDSMGWN